MAKYPWEEMKETVILLEKWLVSVYQKLSVQLGFSPDGRQITSEG